MAEFRVNIPVAGKILRAANFLLGPTASEAPGFSTESVMRTPPAVENPGQFTSKYPTIGKEYKRSVRRLAWARSKGYHNTVAFLEDKLTLLSEQVEALENGEAVLPSRGILYKSNH